MNTPLLILAALTAAQLAPFLPVLTTGVSYGVAAAVKAILPKIPGWALPIVAALVGAIADLVAHLAAGTDQNTVTALLLGLAATGAHQVKSKLAPDKP